MHIKNTYVNKVDLLFLRYTTKTLKNDPLIYDILSSKSQQLNTILQISYLAPLGRNQCARFVKSNRAFSAIISVLILDVDYGFRWNEFTLTPWLIGNIEQPLPDMAYYKSTQ